MSMPLRMIDMFPAPAPSAPAEPLDRRRVARRVRAELRRPGLDPIDMELAGLVGPGPDPDPGA